MVANIATLFASGVPWRSRFLGNPKPSYKKLGPLELGEVTIGILENHVRLKKRGQFYFVWGKIYNFIRSPIELEICSLHDYM